MKAYWDSSALIETVFDQALRHRLREEGGLTRTHALAETFAQLTGNPTIRMEHNSAVAAIENLIADLHFVDLTPADCIEVFKKARARGVRGGHVHDLLHAAAADKAGVQELLTIDVNDFRGLPDKAKVVGI
jgi:predicted nucleic acid-binding protein